MQAPTQRARERGLRERNLIFCGGRDGEDGRIFFDAAWVRIILEGSVSACIMRLNRL